MAISDTTLTFQPGETAKTITVQVVGSSDPVTRTFFVNLSNAAGAPIISGRGIGTILGSGASPPEDQFEPNDTSEQAYNFGLLGPGSQAFTNLGLFRHANGLDDNDWYRWTVAQNGAFSFQINYTTFSGTDLDIRLFFLDASGFLHEIASSRNTNVAQQRVSVTVALGEVVYAWVYGFNHSQGHLRDDRQLGVVSVARSHNRMVQSALPVASARPSGEIATARTSSSCPVK